MSGAQDVALLVDLDHGPRRQQNALDSSRACNHRQNSHPMTAVNSSSLELLEVAMAQHMHGWQCHRCAVCAVFQCGMCVCARACVHLWCVRMCCVCLCLRVACMNGKAAPLPGPVPPPPCTQPTAGTALQPPWHGCRQQRTAPVNSHCHSLLMRIPRTRSTLSTLGEDQHEMEDTPSPRISNEEGDGVFNTSRLAASVATRHASAEARTLWLG